MQYGFYRLKAENLPEYNYYSLKVTIRVEASALANWVPVLDVLPPATSGWVGPVWRENHHKEAAIQSIQ